MSNTNYNLNNTAVKDAKKTSNLSALRKLINLLPEQRGKLIWALIVILVYSILTMVGPYIVGITINDYILNKKWNGVLVNCGWLLLTYICVLVLVYLRTILMGDFGQHLLFTLRNTLFNKLQELPAAFFNQNKAGDLISRINNDTDKINQFFSQSLMQFVSSFFFIIGAGIALVAVNWKLGLVTLSPALIIWIFTKLTTPWIKRRNAANLKSVGGMSAEIQESLDNFKVIIAFNRRDYFRKRFDKANKTQYSAGVKAGIANNIFSPVYGLASSLGQLAVLTYGIYLITHDQFTAGFFVTFFAYVSYFYDPLRQMAALWAGFQVALAAWDRIAQILNLQSDLVTTPGLSVVRDEKAGAQALLEFQHVSFHYPDGTEVLHNNSFRMGKGKTYALVGPTGGGKTTTASLIARLYDPTSGRVLLDGQDLRSYTDVERTRKIGFILQEPFLFSGTVKDNILYGNEQYHNLSNEELAAVIEKSNLQTLLSRFDAGLDTKVSSGGDGISLGQRQLIAFMRAVLRNPDLLILDEATANIDTVTEKMLEDILQRLPETTTRVIIAHRLNTIENADEIFFVNAGTITRAGSLDQAVDMLLHGKRVS
jgi:ATP-binding cassette subfamily B protein